LGYKLSKHQKQILEILAVKPNMPTKDLAEMVYGRIVEYKSKEYSSTHRSLITLEKHGLIKRVRTQLTWQRTHAKAQTIS
jgi:DNA-binding MarR family transcriptional regulator